MDRRFLFHRRFWLLVLICLISLLQQACCSHCDVTFYSPVSDCRTHPLRVGYYASHQCGSLHTLSDSDGRPNPEFARLGHPALYSTGSGTKYHEYSAGHYLSIKLTKVAHIYGIAVQGSPNALRYYLKSMELWYKVTINNIDPKVAATTFESFYKEGNKTKRFEAEMRTTTKFTFAKPFFAEEIRVYPIHFYGDKVFRIELYGCYLGRVTVPASVGMNNATHISLVDAQGASPNKLKYYFKIKNSLLTANRTIDYTFISRGKTSIVLGVNYTTGWIPTDEVQFIVQGPIIALKMKLDSTEASPYKRTEGTNIEFRLETSDQPYQMKRYNFVFGDGSTCDYNFCKRAYTRGLYTARGTSSNDFYQAAVERLLIICPSSTPSMSYTPAISKGGIGITYKGMAAAHDFTVHFYSLYATQSKVKLNGSEINNRIFNATGSEVEKILLPGGLIAPSQHTLQFSYTDSCASVVGSAVEIFVDQAVAGLSLRLNQTFKGELIEPVSYFFKNKPMDFYIDVANGTTVECYLSISETVPALVKMTAVRIDKEFKGSYTFTTPGDTAATVSGRCRNRLNVPDVILPTRNFQLKEIPEAMTNFSLELSKNLLYTGQGFQIRLIFLQGNKMSCNITSSTAGIYRSLTYTQLIAYQVPYTLGRKAYIFTLSTNVFSYSHRIDVVCRNVLSELAENVTFQAQIAMTGLTMNLPSFLCHNKTLLVSSSLSQGRPVYKSLFIDAVQRLNFHSDNETTNIFYVHPSIYGQSGWKNVLVRSWNNVSTQQTTGQIRIAPNVTSLTVLVNFTISSSQGLPVRPPAFLPVLERINFKAAIIPNFSGFLYNWSINGSVLFSKQTTKPDWFYVFSTPGSYKFKLLVDGCNKYIHEQAFTILEPIKDFSLTIDPFPVLVNKTVSLTFTPPANSKCVQVDFGNGGLPAKQCKGGFGHAVGCNIAFTSCTTNAVYSKRGNFTIIVTASNDLYTLNKTMSFVAKACYNPIVNVQGCGTNLDAFRGSIKTLYRSERFVYNVSSVEVNCELNDSYTVAWNVYSRPWYANISFAVNDTRFLLPNSNFILERKNHSLIIPCCILHYGAFMVSVEVKMTGHPLIAGYIKIVEFAATLNDTELVASLSGEDYDLYAYNKTIVLNATNSHDPDGFSKNLMYTWYCRDTVLESRDILSIPTITTISVSNLTMSKINAASSMNLSMPTPSTAYSSVFSNVTFNSSVDSNDKSIVGCFGKPFGRLDVSNSTKIISFNSMLLQENHTFEFTVVVEGQGARRLRRSKANQTVFIRMRDTPYFKIRCLENCRKKVDSTGKFTLIVDCTSDACEKRSTYQWTLLQNGRMISLDGKLLATPTSRNFYMRANTFSRGVDYLIKMEATAEDGAKYGQVFSISTNEPPKNGSCTINPIEGIAIQTMFRVNCTGWVDTELPLLYEVSHLKDVLTTVVCRQTDSLCQTLLPVGEERNSTLRIRVRILDSLNSYTEMLYAVQVKSLTLTLPEMNNLLARIQNSTSDKEASQLIGAVTSVLNLNADENKSREILEKSIEIRDTSIILLSKMINSSSDDIIAPLIATIAEVPSEFTQKSGIIATISVVEMTDKLLAGHMNVLFNDLISRSKSLLAAMGMVMKSTSFNLDPSKSSKNDTNATEQDLLLWTTPMGRSIVLNSSRATDNLANVVFSRMSIYEEPLRILTPELGLLLQKRNGSELNVTKILSMMSNKITLPSLENLNLQTNLVMSLLLKVTTFNAYFWSRTSKLINSTLTQLELRSGSTSLSVQNTKEPINLEIKRNLLHPISYQHWRLQQRPGKERVNYHKLEVQNDNSLHIELKPMNYCMDYNIFIKYGSRPSRDDYHKNWTLPDLSTCNRTGMQEAIKANICSIYQAVVKPSLRYQSNVSQSNVNCSMKLLLETKIKDALKECTTDPFKVFLSDTETRNGTFYFGVYEDAGSTLQEPISAQLYNSSNDCQVADNIQESTYFLRSYTAKCRYWDALQSEDWLSNGCKVERNTNSSVVHCSCNHLTSFASDFFIAPNPIDIDKVIEGFKNIKDNLSVVVLISVLSGFYILLVVYLRKKDKKDVEKVSVIVLDNDSSKPFEYLIITVTGARINAGTTAHVFCTLNSNTKVGEPRVLFDPEKPSHQRDQINAFKVAFSEPVKDLTDIRLWHDNAGESPGWYLSRLYVEDLQTNKTYLFICEQWLAVELEDGLIDRVLSISNGDDQKTFSHIFTTKAAADLSDQHLWLSVALKRAHDSFTRVQRITCCMALLFTTMLASAMFFQLDKESKYLWKIGSLVIDYKGIVIGIQSGLIVIPVNFVIAWIFRHSESFANYCRRRSMRKLDGTIAKRKMQLPCGFVVVAWFLAVAAIISSMVLVLFYSMQWGNTKSQQFVLSIFTSFVQSALLIQPLKLIIIALILAMIFKKTNEEKHILDMYKYTAEEKEADLEPIEFDVSKLQMSPLTQDQLKYARKRRRMEIRLKFFLHDFISYLVFLAFLYLVVRGYRDPDEFLFRKALDDDIVHDHFQYLQDVPGLWTWVQQHFIPAIYTQQWYNGDNFTDFKMLQNQEAYRIGLARIRQLRIKPGTCKLSQDVTRYFNSCDTYYSLANNEELDFDIGWKDNVIKRSRRFVLKEHFNFTHVKANGPQFESYNDDPSTVSFSNDGTRFENVFNDDHEIHSRQRRALKFKINRKTIPSTSKISHPNEVVIDSQYLLPDGRVRPNKGHWIYRDMSSLQGFPYYGKFATYSGGGYVASLATDIDFARATAMALEQDSWIDTLTRAVFFEFSVYNANLNFFATGFVIAEVLPTGNVYPSASIRVFKLYRYVGVFGKLVMASEIILVLCLLFFIYKECRQMYRMGCAYFKSFWSWVEITIAVALFTAIILRGFSWYEADKNLTKFRQNSEMFISFHYAVLADEALLIAVTIICFASTLKIMKIISIFPTIVVLKETVYRFSLPLINYALPFGIAFFGFATLGFLLFHTEYLFSSYLKVAETQMLMLIGGSVYHSLRHANEVLGPLFFILFAAFETFVLLNIFLTIINDSIKESSSWKAEARSNDFVDFIEERVRAILNIKHTEIRRKSEYQKLPRSQRVSRKVTIKVPDPESPIRRTTIVVDVPVERNNVNRSVREETFEKIRKFSRLEALLTEEVIQKKLSLTIENCSWSLERLDKWLQRSLEEEEEVTELDCIAITKVVTARKGTR